MKINRLFYYTKTAFFFAFESQDNYLKFNKVSLGMSLFYEKNLEGGGKAYLCTSKIVKTKMLIL